MKNFCQVLLCVILKQCVTKVRGKILSSIHTSSKSGEMRGRISGIFGAIQGSNASEAGYTGDYDAETANWASEGAASGKTIDLHRVALINGDCSSHGRKHVKILVIAQISSQVRCR